MLRKQWRLVLAAVCFACLATDPGGRAAYDPGLSLDKSADLETYSFVGETITYSYLVSNTGDVIVFNVTVDDDNADDVSCPPTPEPEGLGPGAAITCTATHTVTQDDILEGEVTNNAEAWGRDMTGRLIYSPPDTVTLPVSTIDYTFGEPSWITDDPDCPPGRSMTVHQLWLASNHLRVELGICGYYEQVLSAVSGDFTCVSVPGCGQAGEEGGPSLPFRRLILEMPHGSAPRIENVAVTTDVVQLGSPACPTQPGHYDCDAGLPLTVNTELYVGDEFLPQETVRIADVQVGRGKRYVHVEVYPAQYHPDNNQVAIASDMFFHVVIDDLEPVPDPPVPIGADYIIIVDDDINSVYTDCTSGGGANLVDEFADWKRQKGYQVAVVKTSSVAGFDMSDPNASAEAIYDFIADRYHNDFHPPQYVLLIGDAPLIPSYRSSVDVPPNDEYPEGRTLYYYSDWRYTTVDPLGATPADRTPDLSIGRLPVDDGPQCAAALEKILHYDKTPDTVGTWYESSLLLSYFQDNNANCKADRWYMDVTQSIHDFFDDETTRTTYTVLAKNNTCGEGGYIAKGKVMPDGHVIEGPLRYNTDDHYTEGAAAQESAAADVFDNDTVGLAIHRDHGHNNPPYYNTPVHFAKPHFDMHNVGSLGNGWKTPLVISVDCSTGRFIRGAGNDVQEDFGCISEAFIEKQDGGAVAVIAPSGSTNGGYNETILQGLIGAVWNDYWNVNHSNTDTRLGVLYSYMRDYVFRFHDAYHRILAHVEQYHIFGDPEMAFRIRKPSIVTAIDHSSQISPEMTEFVVTAEASEGLNGALVALTQIDANGNVRVLGYGVMTDQGDVTVAVVELFAAPDPQAGPVTLTITDDSITPYQVEIAVLYENIDPDENGSKYAYGENAGWISAGSNAEGNGGIQVKDFELNGWMWGENIGWISMTCANSGDCGTLDYGVKNDGQGLLAGYGWGENVGWVNFSCENTASCGTTSYGVTIEPTTGDFSGRAWAENVGWITFASSGANPHKVTTAWCLDVPGPPVEGPFLSAEDETDWSWPEVAEADWYEVVRGDLATLRAGAGDFAAATDGCTEDDLTDTEFAFGDDPGTGEAFWFLVRSANCKGKATYDSGGAGQLAGRDAAIAASTVDCP